MVFTPFRSYIQIQYIKICLIYIKSLINDSFVEKSAVFYTYIHIY